MEFKIFVNNIYKEPSVFMFESSALLDFRNVFCLPAVMWKTEGTTKMSLTYLKVCSGPNNLQLKMY